MAPSSGTTLTNIKYDAFVSYCFEDTGINFTSHLKADLDREGISYTTIDDRRDKGEEISETLLNKISDSLVSVVIFSENYGGSPQCLDELVEIIKYMQKYERTVLPVFRGVEPTHVQNQNGAFGETFKKMLTLNQQFRVDKIEKWKSALVEAGNISGWDSQNTSSEAEIVNKVVERINQIIDKQPSEDSIDSFVGIAQVKKFESILQLESKKDVQSIGIWGIGGIGKTRMADKVYSRIKNQFDGACFLRNVRQRLDTEEITSLCKDMLSQLLMSHNLRGPLNFSTPSVQRALQRNKFLVILDDVTNSLELKSLVKPPKLTYGHGSRIILTSRDKQVLKKYDCKEEHIYKVEKLNDREALRLFEFHAFNQRPCLKGYKELSEKVANYAKGLPLAVEVLGCNLYDKNVKEWESELERLEEIPDKTINDILMFSYKGLDEMEKNIFLDIACVFWGWKSDQVERILNACKFYATSGISRLHDKALINISHGRLGMHDLLQQMGQNIVCEGKKLGELSRIWRDKDFNLAMTQNEVTEKVEVISVDLSQATDMDLMPETFEKMSRLRVLDLYNSNGTKVHLPKGRGFKSDKLTYLHWDYYPLKSLPDQIDASHLVELKLVRSSIVQLWSGGVEPDFPNLKVMNLSYSEDLISLPDFSKFPKLEILKLRDCHCLEMIPSSIQQLSKLQYLKLKGCSNLTKLPTLPPNVNELILSETALKQLPSWIGRLSQLHTMDLSDCKKLCSLPETIGELKRLEILFLGGCSSLTSLPESLGKLQSLYDLRIHSCHIRSLPSSLCHLSKLENLHCSGYEGSLLPHLATVFPLSNRGINPQCLGLVSLTHMELSDSNLRSLPPSIKHLPNLKRLYLSNCKNLTSIPDFPSSLTYLRANWCTSLRSLGNLFGDDQSRVGGFCFSLLNNINLDDNSSFRVVNDACPRIQARAATKFWSNQESSIDKYDKWDSYEEKECTRMAFLCIPGGRIPEWVEYKEEGSTLKLMLNGRTLVNLSQLAFCFVVSSSKSIALQNCFKASCKCDFVTDDFAPRQVEICCPTPYALERLQSEHVFLWYSDVREHLRYEGGAQRRDTPLMCSEATFKFQAKFVYWGEVKSYCKILRCGVTPLGRNFETSESSTMEGDGSQGRPRPEEEEGPSRKRVKNS